MCPDRADLGLGHRPCSQKTPVHLLSLPAPPKPCPAPPCVLTEALLPRRPHPTTRTLRATARLLGYRQTLAGRDN